MKSIAEEKMKIRKDDNNDVRLALLEQSINNINDTMIRFERRFDKLDTELKEFRQDVNSKLETFNNRLETFNNRLWVNFYWILGTMFTLACAGAGVLAKGFGWFN